MLRCVGFESSSDPPRNSVSLQSEQLSIERELRSAGRPTHRAGRKQRRRSPDDLLWLRPHLATSSSNAMLRLRTPFRTPHRQLHTSRPTLLADLALRTEARLRTWEQRSPLSPSAVKSLVEEGATVYVEASEKRVWRDAAYSGVSQQPPRDADGAE